MVRTTIACARCRRLKVKCNHEGVAPCRNCCKRGPPDSSICVLSGPVLKNGTILTKAPSARDWAARPVPSSSPSSSTTIIDTEEELLSRLSVPVIIQAAATFCRKFPDFRFLHLPSFSKAVRQQAISSPHHNDECLPKSKLQLLCASIFALCGRYIDSDLPPERYASYVRENIQIIDAPDIYTAQALVVMSVYEWSTANAYRGWMFSGMAARMMHSILVLVKPNQLTVIEREIHNRSIWSCYVLDRLIFCGRSVPFDLAAYGLQHLQVNWPIGEQDFAFGQQPGDQRLANDQGEHLLEGMKGNVDNYYDVLVRGFNIWARILGWVLAGGRRLPGMADPENCPWVEGSAWKAMYDEITKWRQAQDIRLRYPETGVEGHAVLGQAEAFAYINLLYYICIIFLGREWIPFLPSPDAGPAGPTDPPLLPNQAPAGFWSDIVGEMSEAALIIVNLLHDLDHADASLLTPFAGYCSFSAATINIYISCYPKYNLGRSPDSAAKLATNMAFLDRLRKVLPMGEGWWTTVWHAQTLYQRASQNHNSFRGKTRLDFIALETSMQDCGANPPTETDYLLPAADKPPVAKPDTGHDHATGAAISLQELSGSHSAAPEDILAPGVPFLNEWNQMWPLWGENQHIPLALEGIPFDYNMSVLDV